MNYVNLERNRNGNKDR